ncbi:MAG: MotA/TolQ/ExbB proton channel family protein, partial [Myxococcales bacterium]|nr:MotA/TolQ/ExbB proton channel family protein [Myxococcales bacterium]
NDGRHAGALAPAGGGRLKLWPSAAATTARALAAGKRPAQLSLFVYESLHKNIDPKQKKSAVEMINAGGLIGWVIVVLGLAALLMILGRVLILGVAAARGRGLADAFESLVRIGRLDEARSAARRAGGSIGRVLRATLDGIELPREQLEDRVSEAMLAEQPRLSRFGAAITVFAAVAPLLGLLGTVTGMISTFDIITEHGTGDPKLLSSGISEALITTELGLIVAIPALLVGTLLGGWSTSIETGIERAALRLVNARCELPEGPPERVAASGSAGEPLGPRLSASAQPAAPEGT